MFCVIMAYYAALGKPAITKPSDQRLSPLGFETSATVTVKVIYFDIMAM